LAGSKGTSAAWRRLRRLGCQQCIIVIVNVIITSHLRRGGNRGGSGESAVLRTHSTMQQRAAVRTLLT
jgi:hypothetical protein